MNMARQASPHWLIFRWRISHWRNEITMPGRSGIFAGVKGSQVQIDNKSQ